MIKKILILFYLYIYIYYLNIFHIDVYEIPIYFSKVDIYNSISSKSLLHSSTKEGSVINEALSDTFISTIYPTTIENKYVGIGISKVKIFSF